MTTMVIIKANGYDMNGNFTYRVNAYAAMDWGTPTIYAHLGKEEMKAHLRGRINKDNSITTQAGKKEIMDSFPGAAFIFE